MPKGKVHVAVANIWKCTLFTSILTEQIKIYIENVGKSVFSRHVKVCMEIYAKKHKFYKKYLIGRPPIKIGCRENKRSRISSLLLLEGKTFYDNFSKQWKILDSKIVADTNLYNLYKCYYPKIISDYWESWEIESGGEASRNVLQGWGGNN